jgi:hypothetical protein
MPISFRISELKVQVGRYVYAFEEGDEADGFQACVSAVNAGYCERKHPYAAKISAAEHVDGLHTSGPPGIAAQNFGAAGMPSTKRQVSPSR